MNRDERKSDRARLQNSIINMPEYKKGQLLRTIRNELFLEEPDSFVMTDGEMNTLLCKIAVQLGIGLV